MEALTGEGLRTGELAAFIRLSGCNLRCSYCDTKYALEDNLGEELSIERIIQEVDKIGFKNITITGGEPLIHKDIEKLISKLLDKGYNINIETNGSVNIEDYLGKCLITIDYKCPSSLMEKSMNLDNLEKLTENDVLKFVINEKDFDTVKKILKKYNLKCYVYLSPIFGEIDLKKIVEFMKECHSQGMNMRKVRMQVQLHKIVWKPDERGV